MRKKYWVFLIKERKKVYFCWNYCNLDEMTHTCSYLKKVGEIYW